MYILNCSYSSAEASLGVSADECEHLGTDTKAVKMSPPGKWADDNGRDVGFCSTTCGSAFGSLLGFHVENLDFDPRGLHCILLLEDSAHVWGLRCYA